MNHLIRIAALIVLLLLENWFSPFWWSILIIPFLFMALLVNKLLAGFSNAFLAGLFTWGGIITYQYFTGRDIIASRMAQVFQLPGGGVTMLISVALIGALLAGLGGITGASLRTILKPAKKNNYYY